MKTNLVILPLFFCGVLTAQTTLEEYNYLTKGYKIQIESGLDMKKGYRLEDLMESSVSGTQTDILGLSTRNTMRKMSFKGLYRDGENTPCAVLVIYYRQDTGFSDYLCIPHFDSSLDIWNLYFKQIQNYERDAAQALAWGLARVGAYFARNN